MNRIYNIEDVLEEVKEINGAVVKIKKQNINKDKNNNSDEVLLGEEKTDKFKEGKVTEVYVNKYERDRGARDRCIEHYGAICKVCDFDFETTYGSIGKGYIHVHHIIPLHKIKKEHKVDAIKELVPVCPNCHAMLHRNGSSDIDMTIEELKELISRKK